MICQKCGETMPEDSAFCQSCGAELEPPRKKPNETRVTPNKKSIEISMGLGIAFLVLVSCLVVDLFHLQIWHFLLMSIDSFVGGDLDNILGYANGFFCVSTGIVFIAFLILVIMTVARKDEQ